MPASDVFGPIVDGSVVERAAIATLRDYLSQYLAEAERQTGRAACSLPRVRSFSVGAEFAHDVEDQLPAVTLIAPGLAERPEVRGSGSYRARWSLGVAVLVAAGGRDATRELAKLYTAAVRTCLVQQRTLGGAVDGVEWIDERYDDAPPDATRTLSAGQAVFIVDVEGVLNRRTGPRAPAPDPCLPSSPFATVADVDVTLTPTPEAAP